MAGVQIFLCKRRRGAIEPVWVAARIRSFLGNKRKSWRGSKRGSAHIDANPATSIKSAGNDAFCRAKGRLCNEFSDSIVALAGHYTSLVLNLMVL